MKTKNLYNMALMTRWANRAFSAGMRRFFSLKLFVGALLFTNSSTAMPVISGGAAPYGVVMPSDFHTAGGLNIAKGGTEVFQRTNEYDIP
jgi:hypothetical protein